MLGDLIYEAEGKLMNMRVISVEEERPKIEVTISQNGLLKGVEITSIVTYSSISTEQGTGLISSKHSCTLPSPSASEKKEVFHKRHLYHYNLRRQSHLG